MKVNLKFKKQIYIFLFYAVSNTLNKGLSIIALPILSNYLSINDFGLWSLSNVCIVLLAPFISFNGYASVLREGVENKNLAWNILRKYVIISSIISFCIGVVSFFDFYNWVFITLLLGCIEAFQVLLLGWYRSQDNHINYLLISLIKISSIIFSIIFLENINLVSILHFQLFVSSSILIIFYSVIFIKNKNFSKERFNFNKIMSFSILLIPHNVSLWILSSSDRFIIKSLINEYELGLYSICYSIGLVIMLLNTGLALVLPNYIIKNYNSYIVGFTRIKLISCYSFLVIILNIIIFLSLSYFKGYFEFLKSLNLELMDIILWIINGLYLLGIYFFYSNVLFYKRKVKSISISTLFVALINIVVTILLLPHYGIKGAAIATFVSYLIYLITIFYFAQNIEKRLNKDLIPLIGLIIFTLVVNLIFFNFLVH